MADLAARIVGPTLLTNTTATLYTVPAVTQAIVRNIILANTSATAATARLSIGVDAAGTRFIPEINIPPNSVYDWGGFLVMEAAETLRGHSGTTNVISVTVSGVLVT